MEILRFVLITLVNVVSHKDLIQCVATKASAGVFMDLLQMFRDKDELFSLSVALLRKVVRASRSLEVRNEEMKDRIGLCTYHCHGDDDVFHGDNLRTTL